MLAPSFPSKVVPPLTSPSSTYPSCSKSVNSSTNMNILLLLLLSSSPPPLLVFDGMKREQGSGSGDDRDEPDPKENHQLGMWRRALCPSLLSLHKRLLLRYLSLPLFLLLLLLLLLFLLPSHSSFLHFRCIKDECGSIVPENN